MNKALQQVAERFAISPEQLQSVILKTVMPSGKQVSEEQFTTFVAVANEYKLNPLTKEIYAFPAKGGGIQPIVSIDGWLRVINSHPDFNGMTFEDHRDSEGRLTAITCNIYKKGIDHPVQVTEYMDECKIDNKEPWQKWPSRMLRHKTAIQAGRYAFGLSGIIDPDEADRFKEAGVIEPNDGAVIENEAVQDKFISDEEFKTQGQIWGAAISQGRKTLEEVIDYVASKDRELSESQVEALKAYETQTEQSEES